MNEAEFLIPEVVKTNDIVRTVNYTWYLWPRSQASPVLIFVNLPILCIIVYANRRSKRGRPGTKAMVPPLQQ